MKGKILIAMTGLSLIVSGCGNRQQKPITTEKMTEFKYEVDAFADLQVLRYKVPGFESLNLKQKELVYYLSQAACEGRDIFFDQNGKYNLAIRRTLEAIYNNYKGDKTTADYKGFEVYLKRVWFSSGIYHHYGATKFLPEFSKDFFVSQVMALPANKVPTMENQSVADFLKMIEPVMFDPNVLAKRTNQAKGVDLIRTSANNYYGDGISQREVETFYAKMKLPNDTTAISYGLNSRLVKENKILTEKQWKVGGLYSPAIERIVGWLKKAEVVAENEEQRVTIEKLIAFYQTGDLKTFDEYSIAWVKESAQVDFVNGFIESYGDPLGIKASWESIVNFKNEEATKRTETISKNAQWFEDHSPVDPRFKKKEVKGVTAKVITATQLGGDCYPSTPIGVNLPNADWIRKDYGSKSVTIENIMEAYDQAGQHSGFAQEFAYSETEVKSMKDYGFITDILHTDLHECLGHGSGQLLEGTDPNALKAYGSTIEEARADLFGLYFIADAKLVELGIIPNKEAYKAEYYSFMMNGLMTQLTRIEPGKNIEEAHMRNRQLIARWVYEKGKTDSVVAFKERDGKTYVVVNDYDKLRNLFGQLLAEIQRIKSEGDYKAAANLVETYAVKVDKKLHAEVLARYKTLNLKPYKGFVNPNYELVQNSEGKLIDVKVTYNEGYTDQMLRYSKDFSPLPTWN